MDDFLKEPGFQDRQEPRFPASLKSGFLEFQREDWASFRTIEGLQQKAGVAQGRLRRLVLKELADNGLDAGSSAKVRRAAHGSYFVEDNGPGIDGTPEEIARRFSISRPMVSSKLFRLPTRGALGNGLRVVVGAVLASGGSLVVTTRNQRIVLRPETDGTTTVVERVGVKYPIGTRIEISLGPDIPADSNDLLWARQACEMADSAGSKYDGKASPFWYDAPNFHELFLASGQRPARELVAKLEGCSGAKAGDIVAAAGLGRLACTDVTRDQARRLLDAARGAAREVKPERLGMVGEDAFPKYYHAVMRGVAPIGASVPKADIPFVVEAWAQKSDEDDIELMAMVNRTPAVSDISAYRYSGDKTRLVLRGGGLGHYKEGLPAKGGYEVVFNVTTPYCPITSDSKEPDLSPFCDHIADTILKAIGKAKRAAPKERKVSQKDIVLENLDEAIRKASGDGQYQFNERQVYYVLRDVVQQQTGSELKASHFSRIITDYETEHGEIPGMYREPRGSLLHPHSSDGQIALGTLMVAGYERPDWTFNKLLYIEKEGFTEALKAAKWPERHDCALFSSKGFTTRAARDLVDKMVEHDEPVTVFCVHDADAFGSMIHQTFQDATKARDARKVKIVNLGLEPWEAIAMGLAVEDLDGTDRAKAVADYITDDAPDDDDWAEWLQTHRVELNAMTTPQFIAWLDGKMARHSGKLIPPATVLEAEFDIRVRDKVRAAVMERILRDAGFERQVDIAVVAVGRPDGQELAEGTRRLFEQDQSRSWRDHIEIAASERTNQ